MPKKQHFAFAFPEPVNDLDSEKENCFSLYFSLYLYCSVRLTMFLRGIPCEFYTHDSYIAKRPGHSRFNLISSKLLNTI